MELFTFPMGMVQLNDFLIGCPKICPPGFHFDLWNQKNLTVFVHSTLSDFISGTQGKLFFKLLTANIFPITSDIYGFSVSGRCDVFAVLFGHIKPSIFAFPAKIAFDDEIAAGIDQNRNIVNGIISRIKANQ